MFVGISKQDANKMPTTRTTQEKSKHITKLYSKLVGNYVVLQLLHDPMQSITDRSRSISSVKGQRDRQTDGPTDR